MRTKWLFVPTQEDTEIVEAERQRLQDDYPWLKVTRSDAMRSLFNRANEQTRVPSTWSSAGLQPGRFNRRACSTQLTERENTSSRKCSRAA